MTNRKHHDKSLDERRNKLSTLILLMTLFLAFYTKKKKPAFHFPLNSSNYVAGLEHCIILYSKNILELCSGMQLKLLGNSLIPSGVAFKIFLGGTVATLRLK